MLLRLCFALVLAGISSATFAADVIVLQDGSKNEGTILEETNDTVILKVKFGQATYQKKEIKEIIRGNAAPPAADVADLRDVVTLKSGEEHRGLLVSEDNKEIVFDLIVSGKNVSKT